MVAVDGVGDDDGAGDGPVGVGAGDGVMPGVLCIGAGGAMPVLVRSTIVLPAGAWVPAGGVVAATVPAGNSESIGDPTLTWNPSCFSTAFASVTERPATSGTVVVLPNT